jgi:hypothetical protein
VVGFVNDQKRELSYWIIRNSWTTNWGDAGYGYLRARGGDDTCGITQNVFTVEGAKR